MTAIPDWNTTPTRHVAVADIRLAYRRLGPDGGVPVVLLNHWGANLDNFDPPIVEGLAVDRPVYAMDYRGVGQSDGLAPRTVREMATDIIAAIRALGLKQVDVIGFSLGGFVAQQVLIDAPELLRRVILAGTGPAGGIGIDRVGPVSLPRILRGLVTFRDPKTYLFFTGSAAGRNAAKAFLGRIARRKQDRDVAVGPKPFLQSAGGDQGLGQAGAASARAGSPAGAGGEWRHGHHGADDQFPRHGPAHPRRRAGYLSRCRTWRHLPIS